MTFKTPYPGHTVMDIAERDELMKALDAFEKNRVGQQERDQLYNSLIIYVDYLIDYCNQVFDGKKYSFDHIVPQLFVLEVTSNQQWKQFLRCSLYALQEYLVCLKAYKLHRQNVHQYKSLVLMLVSDAEWLLANYEMAYNQSASQIQVTCGASRQLSTLDLKFSMNELFFIDDCNDLSSFDMRDVKPNFMFIVRQFLETIGNRLIGFRQITDNKGKPIHKFTQVSWDYLSQSKIAGQCIWLPYQISAIHKISKWSNSFVHARWLHASYIQFYALDFVNHLMAGPQDPVKCHDGRSYQSTLLGDFRIEHYNQLKADFEGYVKSKHLQATVDWLPLNEVGAYILSLA